MNKPDQIICGVCHKRPAIHHIYYGGTGKSSDFCDECFQFSASPDIFQATTATREAHCEYCGGQPCAGGTDALALITGVQKSKYMCMPCTMEYHRFSKQQLAANASNLSQQEQLAVLRKMLAKVDAHMKLWILERGSQ